VYGTRVELVYLSSGTIEMLAKILVGGSWKDVSRSRVVLAVKGGGIS
jgi:hypothetical protein